MSLDKPMGGDDEGKQSTHLDHLQDETSAVDSDLELHELKNVLISHIQEFKKLLSEKELAVFQERLAAEDPKTLQEVADQFGLTRERVRQIEVQVIEKLRNFYKKFL